MLTRVLAHWRISCCGQPCCGRGTGAAQSRQGRLHGSVRTGGHHLCHRYMPQFVSAPVICTCDSRPSFLFVILKGIELSTASLQPMQEPCVLGGKNLYLPPQSSTRTRSLRANGAWPGYPRLTRSFAALLSTLQGSHPARSHWRLGVLWQQSPPLSEACTHALTTDARIFAHAGITPFEKTAHSVYLGAFAPTL